MLQQRADAVAPDVAQRTHQRRRMHNTAHAWLCAVLLLLIGVPAGDESKPQDDNLVGTPHYMSVAANCNTPASSAASQAAAGRVLQLLLPVGCPPNSAQCAPVKSLGVGGRQR